MNIKKTVPVIKPGPFTDDIAILTGYCARMLQSTVRIRCQDVGILISCPAGQTLSEVNITISGRYFYNGFR